VRLKANGSLDYRPVLRPESSTPWDDMTYEEQRQDLIDWLLYYYPTMTPEKAAEHVDAVFPGTQETTDALEGRRQPGP
jgi:hypothetical protein